MLRLWILYGFGVLLSLAGVIFLAAEYVRFLSDMGRLLALLLTVGMFAFLGKFFESLGW